MKDEEKKWRSGIDHFVIDGTTRRTKTITCTETRERLSEYVDGLLDGQTKEVVEQHLGSCDDCRAEHASFKTMLDDLGSLQSVRPPADFLDQLHGRMESRFTRVLRKLFLPWHIKLPLELATAMVLVLAVYLGAFQLRQVDHVSKHSETLTVAQNREAVFAKRGRPHVPMEESGPVTLSGDIIKTETQPGEVKAEGASSGDVLLPGREQKTTAAGVDDVDLLAKAKPLVETQRPEESDLSEAQDALMEERLLAQESLRDVVKPIPAPAVPAQGPAPGPGAPPKDTSEQKMPPEVITVAKAPDGGAVATSPESVPQDLLKSVGRTAGMMSPRREPKTTEIALLLDPDQGIRKSEEYQRLGSGGEAAVQMGSPPPEGPDRLESFRFERALSQVKDLIDSAQGTVVSIQYDKETRRPQSVEAKIPSEHYKAFYEGLKQLANLESPFESIPDTHQIPIPIRILFKSKK